MPGKRKPKKETAAHDELAVNLKPSLKQTKRKSESDDLLPAKKAKKPRQSAKTEIVEQQESPVVKQEPKDLLTSNGVENTFAKTEAKSTKGKKVKKEKTESVESGGQLAEGKMFVGAHISAAGTELMYIATSNAFFLLACLQKRDRLLLAVLLIRS